MAEYFSVASMMGQYSGMVATGVRKTGFVTTKLADGILGVTSSVTTGARRTLPYAPIGDPLMRSLKERQRIVVYVEVHSVHDDKRL